MDVLQRNPTLTRKPILPSWCDCHLFSIRQTIVFFSIFRAVLTFGAFIFCTVVLIVVNDIQLDTYIFLVIIGTVNGIHLVIVGYFIYATKTSNCSIKKLWLIADIVLSIVISAFALFCTVPSNFYITVGVKLMALSDKINGVLKEWAEFQQLRRKTARVNIWVKAHRTKNAMMHKQIYLN
jgi:uncharacterized membrane-anchored protein